MGKMISLAEYAERNGRAPVTIRQKAQRGMLRTAVKIGKTWMVDENEPCIDNRRRAVKETRPNESIDTKKLTITLLKEDESIEYDGIFSGDDMLRARSALDREIDAAAAKNS